eukprot:6144768-Prymnesium_polylepis.1
MAHTHKKKKKKKKNAQPSHIIPDPRQIPEVKTQSRWAGVPAMQGCSIGRGLRLPSTPEDRRETSRADRSLV